MTPLESLNDLTSLVLLVAYSLFMHNQTLVPKALPLPGGRYADITKR